MMRITPMVKNILIINVVIAVIQWLLIQAYDISIFHNFFSLRVVFSDEFAPWQFFTYMWLHDTGSFRHLFGNMLMLFFLAPMLEQEWGSKKFLTFYLICGVGAGVLFGLADYIEKNPLKSEKEAYMMNPNPEAFRLFILDHKVDSRNTDMLLQLSDQYYDHPNDRSLIAQSKEYVHLIYNLYVNSTMVGASGAISGILMALFLLFPNHQIYLYFAIPVKLKYVVFVLLLTDIYSEFNRAAGDNVAHLAHLGGMLIAFILIKYWAKDSNQFH